MNNNKDNCRKSYYFKNKLCTKIEFKNTLTLPGNKPKIKCIKKLSMTSHISNTKIVELSMDVQQQSITSKRLLVEGYLNVKLLYISCDITEDLCSADFKIKFHSYIILNDNTNIDMDKYLAKSTVQNICYKTINYKDICLNFDLLILANKAPLPTPIKKLPNSIIIKGSTNEEVAKIEFDATNKVFIVTSTGKIPDNTLGIQEYFIIKLRNVNTQKTIKRSEIIANKSAHSFVIDLNNFNFSFDDNFIELEYLSPQNITITNYPNMGATHIPTNTKEFYKITSNGLVAYIPPEPPSVNKLPNIIIVDNKDTEDVSPIVTIEFDADNEKLLVDSSDFLMAGIGAYFSFKLKDRNNQIIKANSVITEGSDAKKFLNDLNNKAFKYDDIIEIDYTPSLSLMVTNFPTIGQNYNSNSNKEYFRITPQGLVAYIPPKPPIPPTINKLPNIIRINSNLNNEVARIEFNSDTNKFIITSTGEIPEILLGNITYFSLKLKSIATQQIKEQGIIKANENAQAFVNNLNDRTFEYTDFLELEYYIPASIKITNYPQKGNLYTPSKTKEYFAITPQGLIPYTPPTPPIPPPVPTTNSKIKLYIRSTSSNLEEVATIELNKATNTYLVTSIDKVISIGLPEYFNFTHLNYLGNVLYDSSINNGDNISKLKLALNNKSFTNGSILSLRYVNNNLITVENIKSNPFYMLKESKDLFKIENGELTPFSSASLPNTITFKNEDDNIIGTISFYTNPQILSFNFVPLRASSTFPNDNYFTIKLKTSTGSIKFEETIKGSETFNKLAISLDNKPFIFGDILELSYRDANKVTISNYKTAGTTLTAPGNSSSYYINPTGLELIPKPQPPSLTNRIIIVDDNGDEVSIISFDSTSKRFIVSSTSQIPDVTQGTAPYFTLKLKEKSNNNTKIDTFIQSNMTANNFRNMLNNFAFEFTDYLELDYFEPTNIIITDYPQVGMQYIPNKAKEYYSITPTGLVAYTPTPPTPPIPPIPPPPVPNTNSKIKLYIRNNSGALEEVATIEANKTSSQFMVTSINKIVNLGMTEYFNFTHLNAAGNTVNSISINNGDNITKLNPLNNSPFSSNNIVSLRYIDKALIKVENIKSTSPYSLKDSKALFKIENGELTPFSSTSLPNIITFKNESNNIMGTIGFYTNPKILTFTFTTAQASSSSPIDNYLTIKLKDSMKNIKFEETITGQENFSKLAIALDNKPFIFGDILELRYKDTNKVTISNYQTAGTTFTAPENDSSYTITPTGLQLIPKPVPPQPPPPTNSLPNKIIFNGESNNEIASILFDTDNKTLFVVSSGETASSSVGANEYFSVDLISPFSTIKTSSSINGNENANKFKNDLNGKSFHDYSIISLKYMDKSKVLITNYPTRNVNYNPVKDSEENFLITPAGLVKVNILPTIIIVKDSDDSHLFYVAFNTFEKKLIAIHNNRQTVASNPLQMPYYISIELRDGTGLLKANGYLKPLGDESFTITGALNNKNFDYGYTINLTYMNADKVFIKNISTSTSFNPQPFGQRFTITPNGLQTIPSEITKNTIIVKGDTDAEIVDIKFTMMPGPKLNLTGKNGKVPAKFFNKDYFKFTANRFNTNDKTESTLIFASASDTPTAFITPLQSQNVYFESLITLNYKEANRVQVTNVTIPTSFTKPRVLTESFRVTLQGLKLADNVIKFLDSTNTTVGIMTFDHVDKLVMLWGEKKVVSNNPNFNNQQYFAIEIKDSAGARVKLSSSVNGNQFASKLETNFNYKPFEYGDILTLKYKENQKISISNYPARGPYVYSPETTPTSEESYRISPLGLIPLETTLTNTILVLNGNIVLATIIFDKTNKKLIATSTGKTMSNAPQSNYFKLVLKNGSNIIAQTTLLNNQAANNIKTDLDNKVFDYNYILELTAIPNTAIVTNYPGLGDRFTTASHLKTVFFEITPNGLIAHTPTPTFLDNVINFRSANNASNAATIKFDTASKRLNVTSDGMMVGAMDKFDFTLKSSADVEKIKVSINGGENGDAFASTLNDVSFELGDKIEIGTVDRSRALIDNFPIKPHKYFLSTAKETFTITATGLNFNAPSPLQNVIVLPNIITVQGTTGTATDILASVYFDSTNKKLIVFSTGKTVVSSSANGEYFALVIKDNTDNQINEGIITIGGNADNFATDLNGFAFQDDYIITIRINQNA